MKVLAILWSLIALASSEQKCKRDGAILKLNGHPCASTTRYDDGQKGACGCGSASSNTPFAWNLQDLVTAPNGRLFDDGGSSSWCGRNCGKCVQLTPTGGFVPGEGQAPKNTSPHVFMITNDCPANGNEEWCGQAGKPGTNHANKHGYEAHFDLQNRHGQISSGLGWDNIEVTWRFIDCPQDLKNKYSQCQCH